jgi:hypothetical protein
MAPMLVARDNAPMRVRVLAILGMYAAAGAVAGIVYALAGPSHSPSHAACGSVPVPAAAQRVLAGYMGRIEHQVMHEPGGIREETWSDPLSGRTRQVSFAAGGQLLTAFGTVRQGRSELTTIVNYGERTWIVNELPIPGSGDLQKDGAALLAATYRDEVAHATAKILGKQLVDGRETLHLRQILRFPPLPRPKGVPKGVPLPKVQPRTIVEDTWVDPLTYLPVQQGFELGGHESLTAETWLPRTNASVAQTKLVIPAGFRRLRPNRSNGTTFLIERSPSAAGCSQR